MNIFLIDCDLGELPGHTVRKARIGDVGGIMSVHRLLTASQAEGGKFRPDVLIQMEQIGRRVFLSDLAELDCPKIFWAVDSHLNLFWQRWYGRLFDVVLTPHKRLFDVLPPEWLLGDVRRFSIPGCGRVWRPHDARGHAAAFVGRIDQNRPQRFRFAQLLERRHGVVPCTLPFADMLDLYDDTRVIPNESICREFNFRIMEGASCGCCVLTEDIGEDLAANFEPGREVLTYGQALELEALLSFLAARPKITEKIGLAAQKRVASGHLMRHRSAAIMHMLPSLAAHKPDADAAERFFVLACVQWARSNPAYEKYLPELSLLLERQRPHPDIMAMRLRLLVENGRGEDARKLLAGIIERPDVAVAARGHENVFDLQIACAVAALRLGDLPLLAACWRLLQPADPDVPAPDTAFQACLALADMLAGTGRICQPGFYFDVARHCPETAFELLQMAQPLVSGEESARQWLQKMAECCDRTPFNDLALDYKARISLNAPKDWRADLNYAMACLKTSFFEEGLAEAAMAQELARHAGEEEAFLAAADPQLLRFIVDNR